MIHPRLVRLCAQWLLVLSITLTSGGIVGALATTSVAGAETAAQCDKASSFLTFNTWWHGLKLNSDCTIAAPSTDSNGLATFIWTIVLNIIDDILQLIGYLSVGFLIYGGFKYMTAAGSSDGVSKAKKTITNAIVGLIISIFAVAIVNLIAGAI